MSLDPYQPCPACVGTDKKVKFCCAAIVGDMEKVARLQDSNQGQRAIEALRKLHDQHPGNAWVATSLAAQLMDEAEIGEARSLLHGVLKETPDHPFALALLAMLSYAVEGFVDAKPVIHRALQKAAPIYPELLARVVLGIADEQNDRGRFMSAREHLALALRLVRDDEARRDVFMQLLEFEGDASIPYPLRSVHQFAKYEGDEEGQRQLLLAIKLAYLGLWGTAAGVLQKLVDAHPDEPALWQNLGFCHAWDGELQLAATALHTAAEKQTDFETAVELETIAQLLDTETTENVVRMLERAYEVPPVSRLLSELDERERLVRVEIDANEKTGRLAGVFDVLDRPLPAEPLSEDAGIDDVPNVVGRIFLTASDPDREIPPRASIVGAEGAEFDAVRTEFEAVLGDRAKPVERDEEEAVIETRPRDWNVLNFNWHFPAGTPIGLRRDLEYRRWEHTIAEAWPATKLDALGGRSADEVRGDEAARVPLAAAIVVLASESARVDFFVDEAALRERFGLPAVAPYPFDESTQLGALSSMQLVRVPVADVPDERVGEVVNRAMLIGQNDFLRHLLEEVLGRPSCREEIDFDHFHQTLAELARQRRDHDAALDWLERGRTSDHDGNDAFEAKLRWRMTELRFRAERRDDPELKPLLELLWNYFGAKLPQLRSYLQEIVTTLGVDPPWDATAMLSPELAGAGTTTAGGIWTPGAATESPGEGGGKLYIPGQ